MIIYVFRPAGSAASTALNHIHTASSKLNFSTIDGLTTTPADHKISANAAICIALNETVQYDVKKIKQHFPPGRVLLITEVNYALTEEVRQLSSLTAVEFDSAEKPETTSPKITEGIRALINHTPFTIGNAAAPHRGDDLLNPAFAAADRAKIVATTLNRARRSDAVSSAILSPWGRGKSYFAGLVAEELGTHRVKPIHFSAWHYRTPHEIWSYLYEVIRETAETACPHIVIRSGVTKFGLQPLALIVAYLLWILRPPETSGLIPWILMALPALGGIWVATTCFGVLRQLQQLRKTYLTTREHHDKLGLQYAIGRDLLALITGWFLNSERPVSENDRSLRTKVDEWMTGLAVFLFVATTLLALWTWIQHRLSLNRTLIFIPICCQWAVSTILLTAALRKGPQSLVRPIDQLADTISILWPIRGSKLFLLLFAAFLLAAVCQIAGLLESMLLHPTALDPPKLMPDVLRVLLAALCTGVLLHFVRCICRKPPHDCIALIIDDLDRCDYGLMLSTIECVQLFLQDPQCRPKIIAIFLIEEEALKSAIRDKLKIRREGQTALPDASVEQQDYNLHLEKLFLFWLRLTPLSANDVTGFAKSVCREYLGYGRSESALNSSTNPEDEQLPGQEANDENKSGGTADQPSDIAKSGHGNDQSPKTPRPTELQPDPPSLLTLDEMRTIQAVFERRKELLAAKSVSPRSVRCILWKYQLARELLKAAGHVQTNNQAVLENLISVHLNGIVTDDCPPIIQQAVHEVS